MAKKKGDPIKQRKDHEANFIGKAYKNKLDDKHGDFARYYFGLPLVGDRELMYSRFEPSNATDKDATYIAYKNEEFENAVMKYFNENYEGIPLRPSYSKNPKDSKDTKSYKSFNDLGNFKISKGEDDRGEYISYYTKWNYKRNDNPNVHKTEFLGATKPFEVYDRIYLDKETKPSRSLISEGMKKYAKGGPVKDPKWTKSEQQLINIYGEGAKDALLKNRKQVGRKNFLNDFGTTALTVPTKFRQPTQEELELGRSGWEGRGKLTADAVSRHLVNTMGARALPKVGPAVRKAVNTPMPLLDNPVAKTVGLAGAVGLHAGVPIYLTSGLEYGKKKGSRQPIERSEEFDNIRGYSTFEPYDDYGMPQYGIGGWLEDNGGNLMKTALGAGLSIAGMPQVGVPMAISAGTDMLFGADEESQFRKPAVSKTSQMYQLPARGGMNLNKQPMRSDFTGNSHDQGGIPLTGIGVEVEDGEVRTGDTIHSKDIKITPAMVARYSKTAGIKKGDRGKSVADIVKRADKKFEKRAGDKWNDQARKMVQSGYEQMSNELADIYQIAQEMSVGMPQGNYMAEGGIDLETIMGASDDLANMPMVASAFGALNSFITPPEKVDYQRASYSPTEVTPVRGNYDRIRRVYGNTRGRLNRLNPRGFQNNAAALASAEAESVGDMSSRVDEINAGNKNAASRLDSQTRSRTSMFNSQLSASEAEANAANRGARRSAVESYLSNFATQAGQKARDIKLYETQDRYMDMMEKHLKDTREIRTGSDPDVYGMDNLWQFQDNVNEQDIGIEPWMQQSLVESEDPINLEPWMQKLMIRRMGGRLKRYRK